MDHQFRNAAIGGFNKQDVLDYLESLAQSNREQLQSVQEELAQVQDQARKLMEEKSALQAQLTAAQQEAKSAQEQAQQTQAKLTAAQEENATLKTQLTQAQTDLAEQTAQADALRPDALAYQAVKERSAGMELDAHRRAQGILDEARAEANQMKGQVEQWLVKVNGEYAQARSQIDATMSQAANELSKVGQTLVRITQQLADQDAALEEIETAYSQYPLSKEKVPAPIPLIEE